MNVVLQAVGFGELVDREPRRGSHSFVALSHCLLFAVGIGGNAPRLGHLKAVLELCYPLAQTAMPS